MSHEDEEFTNFWKFIAFTCSYTFMISGKQLGKKLLSEMINNFREEVSNNLKAKQRHSYFVPKQEEKDEAAYVPSDIRDLQKHYPKNVNTMKIKNFHRSQDYKTIARSLQNSGRLFEDDKFPADNRQLSDNVGGNNYIVHYFGRREVRPSEIQWLRPHVSLILAHAQ